KRGETLRRERRGKEEGHGGNAADFELWVRLTPKVRLPSKLPPTTRRASSVDPSFLRAGRRRTCNGSGDYKFVKRRPGTVMRIAVEEEADLAGYGAVMDLRMAAEGALSS